MKTGRILVAEDDVTSMKILRKQLVAAGYTPLCVSCAEEALEQLERINFDAVISDVMMAGISGIELLKTVRAKPAGPPVIILTGSDGCSNAEEALAAGAAAYLLKPVNLPVLLQVLEDVIGEKTCSSD